jgi:Repeat of unknown function (DUF5648)
MGKHSVRAFAQGALVALAALAAATFAQAGSISLQGGNFVTNGTVAILTADAVVNSDATHSTQPLRLELWASEAPFPVNNGSFHGRKLAQYVLPQLPGGGTYSNVASPEVPFAPPPAGTWYLTLFVTEFLDAQVDDGYLYEDFTQFPLPIIVGGYRGVEAIVEYYYAASNTYFITGLPGEIQALDAGEFQGWERTGYQFNGYDPTQAATPATSVAVCRFFNDSFGAVSSHFYALHGLGCEDTLAEFPDWKLESAEAFNMLVPDANGNCPSGSSPVYRLFNNGMGGAPNHRYTTETDVRSEMIAQGWTPEGYGIGIEFCSPD